jgi:hypothetical protein
MIIRYFFFWLPMVVLAIGNGALRQGVFLRYMSELRAHQLSTFTLMLLCAIYVWLVFPFLKITDAGQVMAIGAGWMVMTIVFEFSLGRATGKSWSALLADYNLAAGHMWPVFLVTLCLLPYLFFVVRR